jgi:hypothetical protein
VSGGSVRIRVTVKVELEALDEWKQTEAKGDLSLTLDAPPGAYVEPEQALDAMWDDLLELLRVTLDDAQRGVAASQARSITIRVVAQAGQKAPGATRTSRAKRRMSLSTGAPAGHDLDPEGDLRAMETGLLNVLRLTLGEAQLRHPSEYR